MSLRTTLQEKERIKWMFYKNLYSLIGLERLPIIKVNGKEIIMIHINKTAGTSINVALGFKTKTHLTSRQLIIKLGKERFEEAFTFSFVRNPWDRVISQHKYELKAVSSRESFKATNFQDWLIKFYKNRKPEYFSNIKPVMFYTQSDWLKNFDNSIDLNFIGKFENIESDFKKLCDMLGVKRKLPHLNKSKRDENSYRKYYNTETKDIVTRFFEEDIENFQYEF